MANSFAVGLIILVSPCRGACTMIQHIQDNLLCTNMMRDLYRNNISPCLSVFHILHPLDCFGTAGVYEAVSGDFLDAHSLRLLNPYMVSVFHRVLDSWSRLIVLYVNLKQDLTCSSIVQPNLSASWLFQRAMSTRPQTNISPTFINDLLFANFQSMQKLGNPVLRPFLQDVIQFGPLVKTLGLVMLSRPQILPSIFKQVGLGVILNWSSHFGMLGYYTFLSSFIDPAIRTWVESLPPRNRYQWKRYLEAWKYGAGLDYRQEE